MRIKLSEECHKLVHSFSSTEKAYFKKQNSGSKSANLTAAFDIINATKEFDEDKISAQLKSKGLSPETIYKRLLAALLKSMGLYHAGNTATLQLNEILSTVELLYQKSLFALCETQIQKGVELAEANEQFAHLALLLRWKQKLRTKRVDQGDETDTQNTEYAVSASENFKSVIVCAYLYRRLNALTQAENISLANRNAIVKEILNHEIMDKTKKLPSSVEISRNRVLAFANFYVGRWEEARDISKTILDTTPGFDKLSESAIGQRLYSMHNVLQMQLALYNYKGYKEDMKELVSSIEGLDNLPDVLKKEFDSFFAQCDLIEAIYLGKFDEALKKADDLIHGDSGLKLPEVSKRSAMFSIPCIHFYQGEYSKALAYINKEFLVSESKYLNDKARWLELFCFFLNGDDSVFESRWLSWNRHLKKIDSGFAWEGLIMTALKKGFGLPKREQQAIMQELYQELLPFEQEIRTCMTGAIDFLLWTKSIAQNKTVGELLKGRIMGDN